jgi:hypothetical protein
MKKMILKIPTLFLLIFTFFSFSGIAFEVRAQDKKDMKKAKNLVSMGNKSFNKKEFKSAIGKYAEAIALVGNYPEAHFWKGNAHY